MTTPMPKRIQRRLTKGWRMPEGAVYVGRGTVYGNPYKVGSYRDSGARIWYVADASGECMGTYGPEPLIFDSAEWRASERAVELYRNSWGRGGEVSLVDLDHLRGKDLACWCPLEDAEGNRVPCHADVLLELANRI